MGNDPRTNMFYIIIILAVALDQGTKWFVRTGMDLNSTIPVIEGIFSLTYIQNTGAAFSILQGKTLFLAGMQILVIVTIFIYATVKRKSLHWTLMTSLAMIVGGGIGNLIDRMVHGYVVDFFDVHFWPIFNVADISVCVGCGFLVLYVFFIEGKTKDGKQI